MSTELLRLAVVGSVDDGKSTLIGRLLYETGALFDDQVAAVRRASKQNGGTLDFSLFTDGLKAEREQAITIDVAYRYFRTEKRNIIIVDTPGHVQYTRNMATGASRADAAVVLVDARLGMQPQTRRHAYLLRLLGIDRLAVAINKMDLVEFSQARFEQIRADFKAFAAPLGFSRLDFVPISATAGDNICAPSERMPWSAAGTILQYVESVPGGSTAERAPFRFPVQGVLRPHLNYRGFTGQIVAGEVRPGDAVVVLPSGRRTTVKAIDTFEGELPFASSPQSVTIRLNEEVDVSRGDVLASVAEPPVVSRRLEADLVWLNDAPLELDRPYLVRHGTRSTPARIATVHGKIDLDSLGEVPAATLQANDVGRVTVELARALVVDPYRAVRPTGAFIVVHPVTNATVAAGMIRSAVPGAAAADELASEIATGDRHARLGHSAAVVAFDGSAAEAAALEKQLFEHGIVAALTSEAASARALAGAGLVAVLVGPVREAPAGDWPVIEAGPHDAERIVRAVKPPGSPA